MEELLHISAGETVLDIGCGNGALARRLAQLGAQVTAVDYSEELVELARKRGHDKGPAIDYRVVDATDEDALVKLSASGFDAIVCCMMLMDIPVIGPLYRAVGRLLQRRLTEMTHSSPRFVVCTMHPSFNSNNPVYGAEKADVNGKQEVIHYLKISSYLWLPPCKGIGAPGEPTPHTYYHRPLQELLQEAFLANLVVDGLLEPAPPRHDERNAQRDSLSMAHHWQIPPVITLRMKVGQ